MEHFTLQLPGLPVALPSYSSWLLPSRRMSLKKQTCVGGTQNAPGGDAWAPSSHPGDGQLHREGFKRGCS